MITTEMPFRDQSNHSGNSIAGKSKRSLTLREEDGDLELGFSRPGRLGAKRKTPDWCII